MASPEVGENLTKYELTIDVEKVPLVQKAKGRIEEMYNVMVEFDFIFKDKDGNDEQQWITIQGIGVGCKLAKEYIKSLCNPVESTVVKFPPELYPALSEQTVWARLEKDSHAVLVFNSDDEVSIMGADPLHVTLAMSSLEDMINTFLSSDISDFEPQGHLPSASKKASSLRLDQELRRQSSESGSIIIDEDLTSMRDEVKRAILGCVVEDPFTPWNRASEKADFIDVQNKKPVLVPPDAYELPAREDPLGSLSSGQRIPPSANAEIDLLLDEKLDLRDDVDHQANEINTKDDGLWAFAFDQGYSVSEIEEVFKQHGANLAPSQFHHALVKNRSSRPREKGNKGVLPSGSVLDSKGFPRKLPAPPEMGEKWQPDATTLATIQSQQNDAGKNRDDNLPSDYLAQLHIDFSEEEHCKTDELKKRNQERRKLLSAALDAEPEVHLNSKSDAKKPSPPTTPQKKKGKQKKDTPKAKKTPPTNQAKKKVKATSQAKDNKKPIQGKGIENPYDLLTDDLEEKQEGQRQPAFVPPQVEFTQWGSLKDDSMSRKNNAEKEPDSMPWEVATRKGRTKKDQQAKIPGISYPKVTLHTKSTAASDSAVQQSYSPPKRASRWDQPPSAGQEANKVGIQKRPNNASPRRTSAQPRVSRWDQPPSQGQGSNKVDIQNRPNNASPRRTAAQTDGPKAPVAGYAVPTLGQKPLPQHITAVPGIVNDSQFGGSNWNAMPPQNHIAPYPAPNAAGKDKPQKLRWIVIDGSNVAMTHGNGVFSCKGIKICVDFFLERGHEEITVFVPQWRTRTANEGYPIRDQEILMELKDRGYLTLTPARKVQGKNIVCYDDRFIVKLAENTDGIIVSNDNYRDLWREKPEWREVIENRLLMYSFVGDFFMPPDDPLGQNGPTLDEYLSKPEKGRAKYFPPHRPAGNSYNGLQNAHNHNSAPNLAGGQYLGGFAQPPPMFAVPPPLMQQPPALWGQYQPQNMAWAAPQQPPNQRQKRTRNNSQNFAVNHGNSSQNSDGLHRSSSDVEITEWWKNTADPPDVAASGMTDNKRKGATKKKIGQQDSINRSNEQLRTDSQTQTLFSQLHGVFPESEEQINRILENHPSEASVDKLSAYLLEIL